MPSTPWTFILREAPTVSTLLHWSNASRIGTHCPVLLRNRSRYPLVRSNIEFRQGALVLSNIKVRHGLWFGYQSCKGWERSVAEIHQFHLSR